jgi:hypothetical protein
MNLHNPNLEALRQSREARRQQVFVFLPPGGAHPKFEAALRKHVDAPDFIDIPTVAKTEKNQDAEKLPLWRWFISSQ